MSQSMKTGPLQAIRNQGMASLLSWDCPPAIIETFEPIPDAVPEPHSTLNSMPQASIVHASVPNLALGIPEHNIVSESSIEVSKSKSRISELPRVETPLRVVNKI